MKTITLLLAAALALVASVATQASAIPLRESYLGEATDSVKWTMSAGDTAQFNFDLGKVGGGATLKNSGGSTLQSLPAPSLDETRYNPDIMSITSAMLTFNFSDADPSPDNVNVLVRLSLGDIFLGEETLHLGGTFEAGTKTAIYTINNPSLLAAIQSGELMTLAVSPNISGNSIYLDKVTYDATTVPEPGTMMLLGAGFLGLAIYGKRRKNS